MTTKTMCSGSGIPVAPPSEKGWSTPTCTVCGREFGGQGKKYRGVNYWQTGAPRHYLPGGLEGNPMTTEAELCNAPCPHGAHGCTLNADHGVNTTCSNPDAGPVHFCYRCNCTYDVEGTFHMHDGQQVENAATLPGHEQWTAGLRETLRAQLSKGLTQ